MVGLGGSRWRARCHGAEAGLRTAPVSGEESGACWDLQRPVVCVVAVLAQNTGLEGDPGTLASTKPFSGCS